MVDYSWRSLKIETSRLLCWETNTPVLLWFSVCLRILCDKHMLDWNRGIIYYLSRKCFRYRSVHAAVRRNPSLSCKYIRNTMTAKIKHKRARRKCKIEFRSNLSLSFHFSCFSAWLEQVSAQRSKFNLRKLPLQCLILFKVHPINQNNDYDTCTQCRLERGCWPLKTRFWIRLRRALMEHVSYCFVSACDLFAQHSLQPFITNRS